MFHCSYLMLNIVENITFMNMETNFRMFEAYKSHIDSYIVKANTVYESHLDYNYVFRNESLSTKHSLL